jgi:ABC-2 type transport system ATP-binding protein
MQEIIISHVSKEYQSGSTVKHSVQNITMSIDKGSVFGFLGPNGAGKTTTMKMLTGLTKPTHGTITIAGGSPMDMSVKAKIGFMPEAPSFYNYLTGREFMHFIADIFSHKNSTETINTLLEQVNLTDAADRYIRTYSKGMLQRLGLAQALINEPSILFLDEPLDGLDPLGRAEIKKIILGFKATGKTIFFNSHILSDVQEICDTVAIIDNGHIVAHGTPMSIIGHHKDLESAFVHLISEKRSGANA